MLGAEQTLPLSTQPAARVLRSGRVVACPIDEALLLVIGTGGPMAAGELPAEINDDAAFSAVSSIIGWQLSSPMSPATHGFAALLPVDGTSRPLTTIRFAGEGDGRRYVFTPQSVSLGDAVAILAELAGTQLAATLDALVDVMMHGAIGRRRLSAITALLQPRNGSDGFVELLGESHEGAIFLKGWGRNVVPGVCRAVVSGEKSLLTDCAMATYSRQDAPEGAAGFIGLLPPNERLRARDIEGLVYRGRGGWRYAKIHEQRHVAGPTETPGQIRAVLLQTHSSPEVLLRLRSAANSFDGTETVSTLPLPVRMGIDHAFQVRGGGLLISGWLLDPDGHVQSVRLCSGRAETRLDDSWTRLDRTDVTGAFTDEPMFRNALGRERNGHGFIVFTKGLGLAAAAALHLELTLRDSRRAFMPLSPVGVAARAAALRQIRSIDPENWAPTEAVDRQIVPFLCASERPSPAVGVLVDAGPFDQAAGPPIIIAAGDSEEEDIAPFLGLLALDPETRHAPIALVLPPERFRRQSGRIKQLAQFYRLSLRLMSAEEADDVYDLLEAGVRALTSDTVVLLAGSLLPSTAGWYGKLVAANERFQGSIISPTLAYEDHSVRWAGSWATAESERPFSGRYAGYPLSALTGLKLTRVAAPSFECCIMPREALLLAGGFAAGYLGSQQKGLDLGLRVGRAGIESYWLPSVQMLGSDEVPSLGTAALVERIDQAVFDARWAETPATPENIVERVPA